jgi:hypothetical protein
MLYGGRIQTEYNEKIASDLQEWTGENWQKVESRGGPARFWHATCYDGSRDTVVVYGGLKAGDHPSADTWEWDGETSEKVPTDVPGIGWGDRLVFDEERGVSLLIRNLWQPDALWAWDGVQWLLQPAIQRLNTREIVYAAELGGVIAVESEGGAMNGGRRTLVLRERSVVLGDSNCDGDANFDDIDLFIAALSGEWFVYEQFGGSFDCWLHRPCWGDLNLDGHVDSGDIDGFLNCLVGSCPD